MLQLYIFGPAEEGFLDLNSGTVLDMETVYPLWDEDLDISEFSPPIEIPWTDRNRRLMGFMNYTRTSAPVRARLLG